MYDEVDFFFIFNWLWKAEFLCHPISEYWNRTTTSIPFYKLLDTPVTLFLQILWNDSHSWLMTPHMYRIWKENTCSILPWSSIYFIYIYIYVMSGIHFFQIIKNRYRDILSCHGYIYVQDMKSKSMCHLNFHFAKVEYKNIYMILW